MTLGGSTSLMPTMAVSATTNTMDFEVLQARYALCVLFEYAATRGLIDIAYIEPEHARSDFYSIWGTDDMGYLSRYDGLQCLRLKPLGAYCIGLTNQYTPAEPESRPTLRVLSNLDISEFRSFLLARSSDCLPDTVEQLLRDSIKRATQLQDKGKVSLIECADASLAESIANDTHCKKYCLRAGDSYLVVHAGRENQFRKALRQLGYSLPVS